MRQVDGTKVSRLTLGDLPVRRNRLAAQRWAARGRQESAEAVVAVARGAAKGRTGRANRLRECDARARRRHKG